MWIIKNIKHNNYFQKEILDKQFHFVVDINDATKYHTKWEVNKIMKGMPNAKNIVAIKVN